MKAIPVEWAFSCGTQPAIVIDPRWRRAVVHRLGKSTILHVPGLGNLDLAQDPRLQDCVRLIRHGTGSHLSSVLHNSLVFSSGVYQQPSFVKHVTGRLFDIDVLGGQERWHGDRAMPMVRSGNDHRIDRFVVDN